MVGGGGNHKKKKKEKGKNTINHPHWGKPSYIKKKGRPHRTISRSNDNGGGGMIFILYNKGKGRQNHLQHNHFPKRNDNGGGGGKNFFLHGECRTLMGG